MSHDYFFSPIMEILVKGLLGNWVRLDCLIAVSNRSYEEEEKKRKERIKCWKSALTVPFPTMFSICFMANFIISAISYCPLQNVLNMDYCCLLINPTCTISKYTEKL